MTSATDNRTTELLPCPFCGGEAETFNPFNVDGTWCVLCSECAAATGFEQTESEAIAAWNTRADTEYGGIPATDENMAKYGWVRERTCVQVLTDYDGGPIPLPTAHCSACGAEWGFTPKYCHKCGAKCTGTRDERKVVD